MTCQYVVRRDSATLPQSTTETLYEVSGGDVLLLGIVGLVTDAISSGAATVDVWLAGSGVATAADYSSEAAGTYVGGGGDRGAAVRPIFFDGARLAPDGSTVALACSANRTGEMSWVLWYSPVDPGAKVVAA